MSSNQEVTIVEVGPRDGLQQESVFFPTEKKIELINRLSQTGVKKIEVTSFVHPKVIPQLRDAAEVLEKIEKRPGVTYSALVPNLKGCQRALETRVDELNLFVSASETHNHKNVGMSVADSLKALAQVSKLAHEAGKALRGGVVTAFGCPYEGRVPLDKVKDILKAYADMGVPEVLLGDTTGMANPVQVKKMVADLMDTVPGVNLVAHFHNSRGLGLANTFAAYEAGIRILDSSVGGLGGCPTAVGAMGNVPTEDLVNMMEEAGVSTGIDFQKLIEASKLVKEVLDTDLPAFTFKLGRPVW